MSLKSRIAKAATATAVAGAALLTLAGPASANPNAPYIGYGYANNGAAVWCVQHQFNYFIKNAYINYPAISEDSQWGPETYNAMVWLQKSFMDPPADGIVGPKTGQYLYQMGEPYYTGYGSANPSNAYCWQYLPTI
ncbi:peptidoglycan-binding protein [Kitasatospora sp. NPDC058190]|uniref:peptidoglycan-binding domain-containing protein n=1 Tax=Kitasatospora sp. NPDC058190 TaxID=3346371 RepID=UPI0036D9323C